MRHILIILINLNRQWKCIVITSFNNFLCNFMIILDKLLIKCECFRNPKSSLLVKMTINKKGFRFFFIFKQTYQYIHRRPQTYSYIFQILKKEIKSECIFLKYIGLSFLRYFNSLEAGSQLIYTTYLYNYIIEQLHRRN